MISTVTDRISVSGQIQPDAVAALADGGVRLIVCHRPDEEDPGQPSARSIADACAAAGVAFVHAPVRGFPDDAAVEATAQALDAAGDGRALLYCRSGMRSIVSWALARRLAGDDPETLRDQAAAAGYDLSRVPF